MYIADHTIKNLDTIAILNAILILVGIYHPIELRIEAKPQYAAQ